MTRTRWPPFVLLLVYMAMTQAKPMVGQPPKDIICDSNRIYGAVGTSEESNRKEWLKVEVRARSLQECIRGCYGYRYCYSISYDPNLPNNPCIFYLHTSTNCDGRQLTPISQISANEYPIHVECLKCASSEEALRDTPLVGSDYVKKTDPAGTKILFQNDAENEYETNDEDFELEKQPNFNFKAFKECEGEMVFRVSDEKVTQQLVRSMVHSTLVGSSANCARACYSSENCKRAIYVPTSGICAFNANEPTDDSSDCTSSSTATLTKNKATVLECIRCQKSKYATKDQGKSNDSPLSSSVLVADNAVYARSCTVTFQVSRDLSALGFQPDQEATVASLNECAFICYQNSCSGAIYEPPTGTSNAGKCRVAVRQRENCSGSLQNHYSFNSHSTVALSCFRCVPNRPTTLSPDAEIITSTTSSLGPQPESTEVQKGQKPQTDLQSTIELVHLKHGCSIAFQAESPDKRPKEFQSTFDTSLVVDTADLCATRCYQDGCTGALFLPEQKLCKLGYGDRHSCSYGPLITHFVPTNTNDQIWIHCVSCQTNLKNPKEVALSRVTTNEQTVTPNPKAIGRDETQLVTGQSTESTIGYEGTGSTVPSDVSVTPIEETQTVVPTNAEPSNIESTIEVNRATSAPSELPPEAETESPELNTELPTTGKESESNSTPEPDSETATSQNESSQKLVTVPTEHLLPEERTITTSEPELQSTAEVETSTKSEVDEALDSASHALEEAANNATNIIKEAVTKAENELNKVKDELQSTTSEFESTTSSGIEDTTNQPVQETVVTAKPPTDLQQEGQTGEDAETTVAEVPATTILPVETTPSKTEELLTSAATAIENAATTIASVIDESASTVQSAIEKVGNETTGTVKEVVVTKAPENILEKEGQSVATTISSVESTVEVAATTIQPVETTQNKAERLLTTAQDEIEKAASTAASIIESAASTAQSAIEKAGEELKATTSSPESAEESTGSTVLETVVTAKPPTELQQEGQTVKVVETTVAEVQATTILPVETTPSKTEELLTSAATEIEEAASTAASIIDSAASTAQSAIEKAGEELKATTINPTREAVTSEAVVTEAPENILEKEGQSVATKIASLETTPSEVTSVKIEATTILPVETTPSKVEELVTSAVTEIENAASTVASAIDESASTVQSAIEKTEEELEATTVAEGSTVQETVVTAKPQSGLQQEGQTVVEQPTTIKSVVNEEASTPSEAERLLTTAQDEIEKAASTAASIIESAASTAQSAIDKAGEELKATTSSPESAEESTEPETTTIADVTTESTVDVESSTIAVTTEEAKVDVRVNDEELLPESVSSVESSHTTTSDKELEATTIASVTAETEESTTEAHQSTSAVVEVTTKSEVDEALDSASHALEEAANNATNIIKEAVTKAENELNKVKDELQPTTSEFESTTSGVLEETVVTAKPSSDLQQEGQNVKVAETTVEVPATTILPIETTPSKTEELISSAVTETENAASTAASVIDESASTIQSAIEKAGDELQETTISSKSEQETTAIVNEVVVTKAPESILEKESQSATSTISTLESSPSVAQETTVGVLATTILPVETTPSKTEELLTSAATEIENAASTAASIIESAASTAQSAIEKAGEELKATTSSPESTEESTGFSVLETVVTAKPPTDLQQEGQTIKVVETTVAEVQATTILPVETTPSKTEDLLTSAATEIEEAASTAASIIESAASTAESAIEKAGEELKETTINPTSEEVTSEAVTSESVVTKAPENILEKEGQSVATKIASLETTPSEVTSVKIEATTILPVETTQNEAERLSTSAQNEIEKAASTAASIIESAASTAQSAIEKASEELKATTFSPESAEESTGSTVLETVVTAKPPTELQQEGQTSEEAQTTLKLEATTNEPVQETAATENVQPAGIPPIKTEASTAVPPLTNSPDVAPLISSTVESVERETVTSNSEGTTIVVEQPVTSAQLEDVTTVFPQSDQESSESTKTVVVEGSQSPEIKSTTVISASTTSELVESTIKVVQPVELATTISPEDRSTVSSKVEELLPAEATEIENVASTAASAIDESASTIQTAIEKVGDELEKTTVAEVQVTTIVPVKTTPSKTEELLTSAATEIEEAASTAASIIESAASTAQSAIEKAGEELKETTINSNAEDTTQTVVEPVVTKAPENILEKEGQSDATTISSVESTVEVAATTIQPVETTQNEAERLLTTAQDEIEKAASTAASIIESAASTAQSAIEKAGEELKAATSSPESTEESTGSSVLETVVTAKPPTDLQQEGQTVKVVETTVAEVQATTVLPVETTPSKTEELLTSAATEIEEAASTAASIIDSAASTAQSAIEKAGDKVKATTVNPTSEAVISEAVVTEAPENILEKEGQSVATKIASLETTPSEVTSVKIEATTILPVETTPSKVEELVTSAVTEIENAASTVASAIDESASTVQSAIEKTEEELEATTVAEGSTVQETVVTAKPQSGLQQEGQTVVEQPTTIKSVVNEEASTPSEAERLLTTAQDEIEKAASTAASIIESAASTAQSAIDKAGEELKATTSSPESAEESTEPETTTIADVTTESTVDVESSTIAVTTEEAKVDVRVNDEELLPESVSSVESSHTTTSDKELEATTIALVTAETKESTTEAHQSTSAVVEVTTKSEVDEALDSASHALEEAANNATNIIKEAVTKAENELNKVKDELQSTTSEFESTTSSGIEDTTNQPVQETVVTAKPPTDLQQEGQTVEVAETTVAEVQATTILPVETTPSKTEELLTSAATAIENAATTIASVIDESASTVQSAIEKVGEETTGTVKEVVVTKAPENILEKEGQSVATTISSVESTVEVAATTIQPVETTQNEAERLLTTAQDEIEKAASTAASIIESAASTAQSAIEKASEELKATTSSPESAEESTGSTVLETVVTAKPPTELQQEGQSVKVVETTVAEVQATTALPVETTPSKTEELLTSAATEIEEAASTAASIIESAASTAQSSIEKAGDELKETTVNPNAEDSTQTVVEPVVTKAPENILEKEGQPVGTTISSLESSPSDVVKTTLSEILQTTGPTISETIVTAKPPSDLQQEGHSIATVEEVQSTTITPTENNEETSVEQPLTTVEIVPTTVVPEFEVTTLSDSEKLLTSAQNEIEKAATTAESVINKELSKAEEAIQKVGDELKATTVSSVEAESTGATVVETDVTVQPSDEIKSTVEESEETTLIPSVTHEVVESSGSGFQTATQDNRPLTTLGEILETSTILQGLEITKTEELLPPSKSAETTESPVTSAETTEQPTDVETTVVPEDVQITTQESAASGSTTLPEIVRAVSELVDAIGRNKNRSTTTPEPPVEAVSQLVQSISQHGDVSEILRGKDQGGFGTRGCAGSIQFAGETLTDYAQPFEMILASDTIRECARVCYDLGCTRAAFTRFPRPACLLHFEENELKLTQKCTSDQRLNSTWRFTRNEEAVQLLCVKCGENIQHDEGDNELQTPDEETKQVGAPKQGYTNVCNGRVEFHIAAVASLPKLNVTNDVQADSPADCARKCLEKEGCVTAGFVPVSGSATGGGVCLMTSDVTECLDDIDYHPQHASTVPFVLSCIKCSKCDYALSAVTPNTPLLVKFDKVITVRSIAECAERCSQENCSRAQFDPTNLNCSMISAVHRRVRATDACPLEKAVDTSSIFPVLLDCVHCTE
ncbi:PAN domain protein [Aphelenchoides besseyi]|nr:PAN domain protein [Aphelenchoides besseyi]